MSLHRNSVPFVIAAGLLLFAGGAWWLLRDGRHQTTNNAYVTADFTVVAPKIAGFVSEVRVQDNQRVKAGDVLARIDDRDYQVALTAARADLANARAQLANAQAALAQQDSLIDQARATLDVSQSELTLAQADQHRYGALARDGAGTVQNAQQAQSRQAVASAHLHQGRAALLTARQRTG
ncbi:MAG: HlyD family secretion protein, partial [Stenotrophomonas bentonitica]